MTRVSFFRDDVAQGDGDVVVTGTCEKVKVFHPEGWLLGKPRCRGRINIGRN